MSKRSSRRKWRRMESQRRREQAALREDIQLGEETGATIGQLVERICKPEIQNAIPIMPQTLSQLPVAPQIWPPDWPQCPPNCDATEWRLALENHDYYLLKQMEDGNKKPWFQYPKFTNQYSEFVYLTPEMAEELLKYNPVNRPEKPRHIEKLRRDIVNHRWLQTHESICINKLGNMHDGQNRARAVTKAGVAWPFYCTWNVPPSGIYATDSGERRNENEKLALLFPELKVTNKTAALARAMMSGLENRSTSYTGSEIASFMLVHAKAMSWVTTNLRTYRADLQAVMAKALLWWGEALISPFVERLRSVQFQREGDPAKALFLWLQKAKERGRKTSYVSPLIYYKKALTAIHAHAVGKNVVHITAKEKDIFEWLPGWEVPESAPCKGKVFLEEQPSV